jgi:hypothetical protein
MAADDAGAPTEGAPAEVPEATEPIPDLGKVPTPEPEAVEPTPEQTVEAAVAENTETNHKVTYKLGESEVELQLPPKLRASVIFRAGVLRDDDGAAASKLIQAVLGSEQFEQVMDAMDRAGMTIDDEAAMTSIGNLLNDALATYGVTPGKSEASPT